MLELKFKKHIRIVFCWKLPCI